MATGNLHTLPAGYRLLDTYEILAPLNLGVASVRYAATAGDLPVTVEEYFPARSAVRRDGVEVAAASEARIDEFNAGLAAFLATGRALARVGDAGIAPIHHWTHANGTGYVVTEDVEGRTLAALLADGATLSDDELKRVVQPIVAALGSVHLAGLLHRQINPEAIVVRPDGTPALRHFGIGTKVVGGARQVFDPRASALADITPGYAALEQYSAGGREGPWTDIYGLAAVMYHCVTGTVPADAPYRAVRTEFVPAARFADSRDARLLAAIDAALAVPIASRPQSLPVWGAMLFGGAQQTLLANRAGRTSARGFGRAATPSPLASALAPSSAPQTGVPAETAGTGRRVLRWAVPALAATGIIALMTWVDTGVLRGSAADAPSGEAADAAATGKAFADPLRVGGNGPTMVVVPEGSTRLGCIPADCSDPASPGRVVVFQRPFALSKYEVTKADYARFATATNRLPRPSLAGPGSRPVVDVSWDDAAAYAEWLSGQTGREYRLPSEAEWEYAAHAGADGSGAETDPPTADGKGAWAVGSGPANAWGLHDMGGNVSEWVSDCGDDALALPPADGGARAQPGCESRIRRGSSWAQGATSTSVSARSTASANLRAQDLGFRIAAKAD